MTNSLRLVFLSGPQAVGKMTVGQALERLTDMKLLHNHQLIDLVKPYFEFGSEPFGRLSRSLRRAFMTEAAEAGLSLILTGALPFDDDAVLEVVREDCALYRDRGGKVFLVELTAPLDIRLARNLTENRRRHKELSWATDELLREMDASVQQTSTPGKFPFDFPHLTVDTTVVEPSEAAQRIADWLGDACEK